LQRWGPTWSGSNEGMLMVVAADPKGARLTSQSECTCDRVAVFAVRLARTSNPALARGTTGGCAADVRRHAPGMSLVAYTKTASP
jgi:hypothetical protein